MIPTHPNLNSREHQRQAIDAQIISLEDSIQALKYRRNALAPVSSLPPEIIAIIFSFLPHMLSDISPNKKPDPLVWLRFSHVCHQWRDIALNQPFLWSHVNLTSISPAGAAEILARAKTVPLYLEARGLGIQTEFREFEEELQSRTSHIRHLFISAVEPRHLCYALEGLVSSAPILESLSLQSSKGKQPKAVVPESLFGGTTPRLSTLELNNCDISWKSSLLKGLRFLEIYSLSANTKPSLPVWLGALNEMQKLKRLTLYKASPIAPPIPVEVEHTVTLPSLTHLDIVTSAKNCALALAHLDLPVLTWLCVEATVHHPLGNDMQNLLPYVARHAHGPQDTQPLQSVLVLENGKYIDILAWTTPNIDVEAHNPLTMLPKLTRVALSLTTDWDARGTRIETVCAIRAALPLDDLVTLIVNDSRLSHHFMEVSFSNPPKWPLLRRVRLTGYGISQFLDWLLADKGGCENPLLPSLKELVLAQCHLHENQILPLCDALMKRVEQGVPLEMLDLRTCDLYYPAAVRLLGEIVVDVLGPEEGAWETVDEARSQIISMWDGLTRGPFIGHAKFDDYYSYTYSGEDDDE
jgi:hypothetical protein